MSALEDPTTCNADRERLLDRIPGVALGNEDDVRRSAAVNVNKRYISSTCPLSVLLSHTFRFAERIPG